MVSRKNVGPLVTVNAHDGPSDSTKSFPPYPTTPTKDEQDGPPGTGQHAPTNAAADSSDFDLIDVSDGYQRPRSDSDASHGTWDTDPEDEEEQKEQGGQGTGIQGTAQDIPPPLRISPHRPPTQSGPQPQSQSKDGADDLPLSLRPGPPPGASSTSLLPGQPHNNEDTHGNPWAASGQSTPQKPPSSSVLESNNPYRQQNGYEPRNSQAAWEEAKPSMPSLAPPLPPIELPTIRTPPEELKTTIWGDDQPSTKTGGIAAMSSAVTQNEPPTLPPIPIDASGQAFPPTNPWSLGTEETSAYTPNPAAASSAAAPSTNPAPQPQNNQTQNVNATTTPRNTADRNEYYSIKQVNWYDAQKRGIRRSPILTQNANGPCPLLALVNALVFSTPHQVDTALVETLQTRETISLSLLLDAVFDELMSGRRGSAAQSLPDVDELYAFLLALHTGMNVNPRLVASTTTPQNSATNNFEQTREMRLYGTFNIPLIHGWMPARGTSEYEAFARSAQTFEDAQNIQFAESELEDKQRQEGLNAQEQQVLVDIRSIKTFLNAWPTQLTEYGLEFISRSLEMGQIAILFRNDHFSILYKEPTHGALMTLITDAGYGSHEEIVWESLVDVNGAASEMFSGDFRVVSHNSGGPLNLNSSGGGNEGWQTVPARGRTTGGSTLSGQNNNADVAPPLPGPRPVSDVAPVGQLSASEQEDHDLALALQLQEEEEDRQRQDEERRRREQRLSEQFLSSEGEGVRPEIPPRRGAAQQQTAASTPGRVRRPPVSARPPSGRPAVNRPTDDPADPEAPPSYEQAASDRIYRPAGATAPGVQGSPLNTYDALIAQQSGGAPTTGRRRSDNRFGQPSPGIPGAFTSSSGRVPGAAGVREAEERCTIM